MNRIVNIVFQGFKLLKGGYLDRKILFKHLPRRKDKDIYIDLFKYYLKYGEMDQNYWLYDFPHKLPSEQKEYLYYPEFRNKRNEINGSEERHFSGREKYNHLALLRDKLVFGQFVSSLGFPTPKNRYFYHNNNLYDLVNCVEIKKDVLLNTNQNLFCKLIYGECGKGIYKLDIKNNKLLVDGIETELINFYAELNNNSFIFQESIIQHDTLLSLYPNSINTMRTITVIDKNGNPRHLDSALRIGAGGNAVDNWAAGGLVVGVNEDGVLKNLGIREFPVNGEIFYESHPDTKKSFGGIMLPYFKEAINMALRLHSFMPKIRTIGWDIAFTLDGPCFIEGNDNYEISLNQVANGGLRTKWYDLVG